MANCSSAELCGLGEHKVGGMAWLCFSLNRHAMCRRPDAANAAHLVKRYVRNAAVLGEMSGYVKKE